MHPKDRFEYHMTLKVFKVEDKLFKIPIEGLKEHSRIFKVMFSLPPSEESVGEGDDVRKPILLSSVTPDEFRALISIIYPSPSIYNEWPANLTEAKLTMALRVATMYDMQHIRSVIISYLDKLTQMCITRRIRLALDHDIKGWIRSCIKRLAERDTMLEFQENVEIGIQVSHTVHHMREWLRNNANRPRQSQANALKPLATSPFGLSPAGPANNTPADLTSFTFTVTAFDQELDAVIKKNKWDW